MQVLPAMMMPYGKLIGTIVMLSICVAGAIRNLKEGPMIVPDSRQYKVVSLPTKDPTDDSTDSRVAPAQVLCTERSMIVLIRADLHSNGRHVTAEEFSLGQPCSTKICKASQYSDTEYVIKADLHQCGSELSVCKSYLVWFCCVLIHMFFFLRGIKLNIIDKSSPLFM